MSINRTFLHLFDYCVCFALEYGFLLDCCSTHICLLKLHMFECSTCICFLLESGFLLWLLCFSLDVQFTFCFHCTLLTQLFCDSNIFSFYTTQWFIFLFFLQVYEDRIWCWSSFEGLAYKMWSMWCLFQSKFCEEFVVVNLEFVFHSFFRNNNGIILLVIGVSF